MRIFSGINTYKHFVVSWRNGRLRIAPAIEVVPFRTYELYNQPGDTFHANMRHINPDAALRFLMKHGEFTEKKSEMA